MPRAPGFAGDRLGDVIGIADALEREADEKEQDAAALYNEIDRAIRQIEGKHGVDRRTVLQCRYLDGQAWGGVTYLLFGDTTQDASRQRPAAYIAHSASGGSRRQAPADPAAGHRLPAAMVGERVGKGYGDFEQGNSTAYPCKDDPDIYGSRRGGAAGCAPAPEAAEEQSVTHSCGSDRRQLAGCLPMKTHSCVLERTRIDTLVSIL